MLLTLAYSQPQIEWESTFDNIGFGDIAYSIKETLDGGYILAGKTCSTFAGTCNPDVWIIKTNSIGEIEWDQTYNNQGEDVANEIQHTADRG